MLHTGFRTSLISSIFTAAITLLGQTQLASAEALTDPALALARLQNLEGGSFSLAFDGIFKLPETLVITTNTILDATGHTITLDADSRVRHFTVTNGAILRLVNLTLANGRAAGT